MKKQCYVVALLMATLFLSTFSWGQAQRTDRPYGIFFEAEGGVALSKIKNLYDGSILVDHRIGATAGIPFANDYLAFKAGVYSVGKGESLKGNKYPYNAFKLWTLDIPLTLAGEVMLNDDWRLSAEAGTFLSCGLSARYTVPNASSIALYPQEAVGSKQRFDMGLTMRGSVYYQNYKFTVGGDMGFVDLNRFQTLTGKAQTRSLFLMIGYRF